MNTVAHRSAGAVVALLALAIAPFLPLRAQDARPAALPVAGAPVSAAAVEAQLTAVTDLAVRANLGALIAEASRRGLPAEPLVTKALEGVEKGAPPPRIAKAVEAMAGRLVQARTALGAAVSDAELRAGADALGAGVSPDVLQLMRRVSGPRSAAVALGVLAQLSARNVPAERAGFAVAGLVARGATSAQLMGLQSDVQRDLAVGMQPSAALDLRARQLTSALPPPVQPAATTTLDALSGNRRTPGPRKKP